MGVGNIGDTLLLYEEWLIVASAIYTFQQMPVFHGATFGSGHTSMSSVTLEVFS
uniref:Uncharacterized protein n=1 Tax=Moniliophthora roreri TaxID=221103 RepID=A0A0W0FJH1_MONRR